MLERGTRSLVGIGLGGVLSALGRLSALGAGSRGQGKHFRRAKNVLVILEQGGLSHMDTWDPKPDAPAEHRSIFKPSRTNVPGMQFTELLAKTAKVADKLTVVRSMHHKIHTDDHPCGTQYILSDVHAVHVGVGGDDDLVVAQAVEAILNVERGLEKLKFLILIDGFFREAVGVERLALQRENGLEPVLNFNLRQCGGPKARNKPAQGNALGKEMKSDKSPEAPAAVALWTASLPAWIEVRVPQTDLHLGLGAGEDEAIALAVELRDAAILMDDRKARAVAEGRGLLTIGTIAILDLADEASLLDFESALSLLEATTFHVEATLLQPVLAKVRARKRPYPAF